MREGHLWVIVLAAGDGTRVAALTTDASGGPVPKQYCWRFHVIDATSRP